MKRILLAGLLAALTPLAMAAEITRYVNTASTGGDGTTNNTSGSDAAYASLSAALAAEAQDLVTAGDNYVFLVDGTQDSTPVADADLESWTTDDTNDIAIRPNTGNETGTSFDANKYHLKVTSANHTFAYDANDIYLTIENIQLINAPTTGSQNVLEPNGTGRFTLIGNYLEKDSTGGGSGSCLNIAFGMATQEIINNICYQHGTASGEPSNPGMRAIGVIYNNTIVCETSGNCLDHGSFGTSGGHVKNNILQNDGTGGAFKSSWTPTASDTNITDDATSPDGASFQNLTATFVGATDFALQSGDTNARNNGTDLSADGQFAFSDDILSNTRPNSGGTWDIGAHEEQTADGGGGTTIPIFQHHQLQRTQ